MHTGGGSDSSSDDEHAWTADDKLKWKKHIQDQKMVGVISFLKCLLVNKNLIVKNAVRCSGYSIGFGEWPVRRGCDIVSRPPLFS